MPAASASTAAALIPPHPTLAALRGDCRHLSHELDRLPAASA